MLDKLVKFTALTYSRRNQVLNFIYRKLITRFIYKYLLKDCGRDNLIMSQLFWTPEHITLASKITIWPLCRIEGVDTYNGKSYSPNIIIGDHVNIQQLCHITAASELVVGSNTTILPNVVITDIDHEYEKANTNVLFQDISVKKTIIGKNCYICSGAVILAGTVLGNGCVVAANSVVRGEFPDYSLVAGAPARAIKTIKFKV